jgi:tetratricopeptide (TPR) repeat protein
MDCQLRNIAVQSPPHTRARTRQHGCNDPLITEGQLNYGFVVLCFLVCNYVFCCLAWLNVCLISVLFQRSLRCYNIAKLYFMLGEYELTRRYVSNYLTIREDSASAHKLLGQALENLGQKEKALAQYKCSLELESKQQDLVLKGKANWTRF